MIAAAGVSPAARGSGGIARAIATSSLFACSGAASSRSRPTTGKMNEFPASNRSANGVHSWEAVGNVKPCGMTPTIVRVTPSRVTVFRRIAGSPWKRARLILFRGEPAPQCWLHSQHREEGCAGACARNTRGVSDTAQRQLLALVARDALEAQVMASILEKQAVVEAGRQLERQV